MRPPLVPTLMTAVALVVLVGLGTWQLQRRAWKHDLIARLEAAQSLPPVTDVDLASRPLADLRYRRAAVACRAGVFAPVAVTGGANLAGDPGFLVVVPCAPRLVLAAGWTRRADAGQQPVAVSGRFVGLLVERGDGLMLIPDRAVPPLLPSRPPGPANLPDNHLSYALQWFGFAVTLAVIYGLWLRRRWRDTVVAGRAPAP